MSDYDLDKLFGSIFGRNKAEHAEDSLKRASEHLAAQKSTSKPKIDLPQLHRTRTKGVAFIRATDVATMLERITQAHGDTRFDDLIRKLREM